MKKILMILGVAFLFIFTGCDMELFDNNKGPFTVRVEDGVEHLYSAGKPARGWVDTVEKDQQGREIPISKIKFSKGLPTGEFSFSDENGVVYLKGDLRYESGHYSGKLQGRVEDGTTITMDGDFAMDSAWIMSGRDKRIYKEYATKNRMVDNLLYSMINGSFKGEKVFGKYKNHMKIDKWKELELLQKVLDGMGMKEEEYPELYRESKAMKVMAQGEYLNGEKSGVWEYKLEPEGTLVAVGKYGNNKKIGEWKVFDSKGNTLVVGEYLDGEKHGKWSYFNKDGIEIATGEYQNSKRVGIWKENILAETILPMSFSVNDELTQSIKALRGKYITITGEYNGVKKSGIWSFDVDGIAGGAEYRDNRIDGRYSLRFKNISLEGEYKNSLPNGVWVLHTPDLIMKFTLKDGNLNGPYAYGEIKTGNRCIGNFRNGKLNGKQQYYNKDGKLVGEVFYIDGKVKEENTANYLDFYFNKTVDFFKDIFE